MSNVDIKSKKKKKKIVASEGNTIQATITEVLSLKFSDVIPAVLHAFDIEKEALRFVNQSINQSTNQSINQSINQSVNQSKQMYFTAQ